MPDEFCREGEFPLLTIHVHFYAPTAWSDDEEKRVHDALAAETERFRQVAYDLVNGIVPQPQNLDLRIGLQHH